MAFALAVGDLVSPLAVAAFASSTEPPLLGVVTKISPTTVVWQDGREVTYTPSTGASVDEGLSKFEPTLGTPFQNAKVRPNGTIPFPNPAGRAEGFVVLVGNVTNALVTALPTAIIRFGNGLYTAVPVSGIEVIPGA